jgi:hypothetical protein
MYERNAGVMSSTGRTVVRPSDYQAANRLGMPGTENARSATFCCFATGESSMGRSGRRAPAAQNSTCRIRVASECILSWNPKGNLGLWTRSKECLFSNYEPCSLEFAASRSTKNNNAASWHREGAIPPPAATEPGIFPDQMRPKHGRRIGNNVGSLLITSETRKMK